MALGRLDGEKKFCFCLEGHKGDFAHFLSQARGSLYEVETQLIIAQKLGFASDVSSELSKTSELGKIINGLIRKLSGK